MSRAAATRGGSTIGVALMIRFAMATAASSRSLLVGLPFNGIGIDDPTVDPPRRYFSYETEAQAAKIFDELVIATVEGGSRLVYNGPRLLD